MILKIEDGSYIDTGHVSRYFVSENFTTTRYEVKVSMNGPQMPFTVSTHGSPQEAHEALDGLIRDIEFNVSRV